MDHGLTSAMSLLVTLGSEGAVTSSFPLVSWMTLSANLCQNVNGISLQL